MLEKCQDLNFIKFLGLLDGNSSLNPDVAKSWGEIYKKHLNNYLIKEINDNLKKDQKSSVHFLPQKPRLDSSSSQIPTMAQEEEKNTNVVIAAILFLCGCLTALACKIFTREK